MKVVSALHVPGYTILSFEAPLPRKRDHVMIDNKVYKTHIVYDMPKSIGVSGKIDAIEKDAHFF